MNKEKLKIFEDYIKLGISPLLVQNMSTDLFDDSVVIDATISKEELNGHYENMEFCPPVWYKELLEKSKANHVILIIKNINEISLEEQTKFVEILKYKKVSTFDLPENCLIVVTYTDLNTNKINEEVYSLVAQI